VEGPNLDQSYNIGRQLQEQISKSRARWMFTSSGHSLSALRINVDRQRAAEIGLTEPKRG